jgi:hypothetical protein
MHITIDRVFIIFFMCWSCYRAAGIFNRPYFHFFLFFVVLSSLCCVQQLCSFPSCSTIFRKLRFVFFLRPIGNYHSGNLLSIVLKFYSILHKSRTVIVINVVFLSLSYSCAANEIYLFVVSSRRHSIARTRVQPLIFYCI